MIENMAKSIATEKNPEELQFDILDGWEDLSDEHQSKITKALDRGHVEDEEWNGVSAMICPRIPDQA
jgi:hypothetical protein